MWRIHLLKILLLGILSNLNASLDSNCNGYTVDKCELGEDTVIETLKDSTEYDCQFFCNIVYSGVCKFFIFDKQQVVCQLINEELKTYTDTCRKFGGPPIPSIQECEALEDSCKEFLEGFCRYEGDLLEHLDNIKSPTDCQTACDHLQKCEYFVYDYDTKDCELLDSTQRKCDQMRGPPEPSYEECQEEISTTSPLPTPTVSVLPTSTHVPSTTTTTTTTSTTTKRTTTPPLATTSTTTLSTTKTTSSSTTTLTTTSTTTTTIITTTKRTGDYALMLLAGLSDSVRLSNVEIVDPFETDSNCVDPTDLDTDLEGMVAEMFEGTPLTCGGSNGENLKSCFTYSEGMWKLSNIELVSSRSHASSIRINETTIWVTGGLGGSGTLSTTEILSSGSTFKESCYYTTTFIVSFVLQRKPDAQKVTFIVKYSSYKISRNKSFGIKSTTEVKINKSQH